MGNDVKPVPDAILGGPFPGLQTVAMGEVMSGFPKVESLITVLDGIEEGGQQVGGQKGGEHVDGLNDEQTRRSSGVVSYSQPAPLCRL